MLRLHCGFQPYDWGKLGSNSAVAALLSANHVPVDPTKRYAELWIGTHPSLPSKVQGHGEKGSERLLSEELHSNAEALLGIKHISEFGPEVPFLLKVLSIDKALSIQAHPDLALAKQLHAKDPAHYPDPNHKPELVVALTDYEALCCFRPLTEIALYLHTVAPLRTVIRNADEIVQWAQRHPTHESSGAAASDDERREIRTLLRTALDSLYHQAVDVVVHSLKLHVDALTGRQQSGEDLTPEDRVFLRVHTQFPGDVGCWMVYILNLVRLKPGDGLFLAANEPHSYLSGDSIEIMAASDNVVRAGLTPKFKDVDTLLDMLTYRTDSLQGVHFTGNDAAVQTYAPPPHIKEFQVTAVRVGGTHPPSVAVELGSLQLAVVVEGKGTANNQPIKKGDIVAFSALTGVTFTSADSKHPLLVFLGGPNERRGGDALAEGEGGRRSAL